MEIFIYIIIFIIGSFIGSFASLAVYRIPLKQDILIKHSYCPNCKEKLVVKDLIPILSYIFLKGKCSHCGEKIRPRYLILEMVSGLLFLLFVVSFKLDFYNIDLMEITIISFIALFFITLILIAGIDKESKNIEHSIILFDIFLLTVYIVYIAFIGIDIKYDLIIFSLAIVFYVMSRYLLKERKAKYIVNLAIILLLSKIFMNSYIILFATVLTVITTVLHKILAKTEVPIAFYYVIFIISLFIGANFII